VRKTETLTPVIIAGTVGALPQQLSSPANSGGLRPLLAGHRSSYDSERKRARNSGRTSKNLTCAVPEGMKSN
jgi:hypothetical protein